MSKHSRITEIKTQPRRHRGTNQARLCAILALFLAGCETQPGRAVGKFWDRAWGPANEGRPSPPGANTPFPNLGTVPPRPETPDMAAREALATGLAGQREASRAPLGALPGSAPRGAPPPPALAPALTGMAAPAPTPQAPPVASAPEQAAPAPVAAPEPAGIPAPPMLAPAGVPPPPVLRDAPRRP